MTAARVREWALNLENRIHSSRSDFHHIESAARDLIASVRAEAIEEAAKVCDEEAARRKARFDTPLIGDVPMIQAHKEVTAHALAAAIRALVKERKGEEMNIVEFPEQTVRFVLFLILLISGMSLSLYGFSSNNSGMCWIGGMSCGLSMGFWAWFLTVWAYPQSDAAMSQQEGKDG